MGASNLTQDELASEVTVPVVEEKTIVSKRRVSTGKVRVHTNIEKFQKFVTASLETESLEVRRVKIDRIVDNPPETRTEGDLTIIPVLEEVLVVEKKLLLKEELHIRRVTRTDAVETPVTLRRQNVSVERTDAAGQTTSIEEA